jgi:hypothetical protein
MLSLLTLVTLSLLAPRAVRATACVAMDINWNLLAFGLDGKDWNAGTQDTWASGAHLAGLFVLVGRTANGSIFFVTRQGHRYHHLGPPVRLPVLPALHPATH